MHTLALLGALDPQHLIEAFGIVGVGAILFAETGLLIGFFLPGDSLLFIAGFAAAGGVPKVHLPLGWLIVASVVGALLGAEVGYWIGRRVGAPLFERPDARMFKRKYVDRADYYFERFGPGKAVVLARFVPIVRTFLNPLAGVAGMPLRDFTIWNIVGGTLWAVGVVLLGYNVGNVGFVRNHIELLVLCVVVISVIPILVEVWRTRGESAAATTVPTDDERVG